MDHQQPSPNHHRRSAYIFEGVGHDRFEFYIKIVEGMTFKASFPGVLQKVQIFRRTITNKPKN